MSQNKFASLPVLQLKRSRILLFLIFTLHLIALASIMYSVYFHVGINISIGVLIGLSFYYYLLYYKKLTTLNLIKYRQDGLWILGYKSKPLLVSIEPQYFLTEWLIVLRFKIGQTRIKNIPIFIDMLSPQDFRLLRVVLPYIQKMKKPGDRLVN